MKNRHVTLTVPELNALVLKHDPDNKGFDAATRYVWPAPGRYVFPLTVLQRPQHLPSIHQLLQRLIGSGLLRPTSYVLRITADDLMPPEDNHCASTCGEMVSHIVSTEGGEHGNTGD